MSRILKVVTMIQAAVLLTLTGCFGCDGQPTAKAEYKSGIPILPGVQPIFGPLPKGVTAFYPSFQGDAFFATLPARPQESLEPEAALQEIAPVLRALGFRRSLDELGVPDEPLRLPPPDLAGLAEEVCGERSLQEDRTSRSVCSALRGNRIIINIEGVSPRARISGRADEAVRNAYGVGLAELKAGFERAVLQYPFRQLVGGVPIEGAGVVASRLEGESLSRVHGTLFDRFVVVNRPARDMDTVLEAGRRTLGKRTGDGGLAAVIGTPQLVLLPSGSGRSDRSGGQEVPALRHAWRAVLAGTKETGSWVVWIDAETGGLLNLAPQFDGAGVTVTGERWRRDPGTATEIRAFEVDPAVGDVLTLQLGDVFQRVDRKGDEDYGDGEVAVTGGSFNISTINDEWPAVCKSSNVAVAYRQVHAYSHLYSFWKMVVDSGTFPKFPQNPMRIWLDHDKPGSMAFYDYVYQDGDGESVLRFPQGDGFLDGYCPQAVDKRLNGVQDVTTIAHEMSHLSVKRLQERRPPDWCGASSCPVPHAEGRVLFHDFADALATAYTSTSCISGWTDKNWGGLNATRDCKGATSESAGFPRRIDAAVDRFPGHRNPSTPADKQPYADGQIAAAGLWKVRQGMLSKEPEFGAVELWSGFHRALWDFGMVVPTCTSCFGHPRKLACTACDGDIYRYLQDLEMKMVAQWVSGIGHTSNKVVSGWAEAGIFLVPYACLDGFSTSACPQGGGDAVIQALDRDPDDDPMVDGVVHPEWDYLERGGLPPRFRIWTGPRFKFKGNGSAFVDAALPCHTRYQVEAASDASFNASSIRWTSGVKAVPASPGCYAELNLGDDGWAALQGTAGSDTPIYYRVRTWDSSMNNERISTAPGAKAFVVPPPFIVVNDDGKP